PAPAAAATVCPAVVAHRGETSAPEHTLAGMRNSVRAGASVVEMDVRWTRGNAPVVLHDATIDRTTNGSGAITDLSLTQMRQYRIDAGTDAARYDETIPTLYQALRAARDAGAQRYLVELKGLPDADEIARTLARFDWLGIRGRVVVQSFHPATLDRVRGLAPDLATALISRTRVDPRVARSYGTRVVLRADLLDRPYVDALHAAGVRVLAFTPNTTSAWSAVRDAGADGAITDRVAAYRSWCG
ncbi:MAG: glycerophosphodiester phosphodiesterase, partial [Actinomycetota bacterium]|nr:glycerophosphodiester phosphodiesterase [Actinomycetota bacterium]